jgi:DNA polymerase-3 subunit gamma/tau
VEAEGLTLIARAAEGSVRDAQSMLDQAIVQAEAGLTVTAASIRDMLGLADRAQTIGLFEQVMRGEAGPAIETFRTLYGYGADPGQVMLDLLEHCHGASVAKAVGPQALTLPREQAARPAVGAAVSPGVLARLWQMLLRAYEEVRKAPDAAAAVDMALIRLAYAADLPGPEEALKKLQSGEPVGAGPSPGGGASSGGGGGGGGGMASAARLAAPQVQAAEPAPTLQSFADVIALIDKRRDISLRLDVERFVRPISFRPGVIEFEPAPGAPGNLIQRLASRLKEWTGTPWLIAAQGGGGAESLWERNKREEREARIQIEADPFVQAVMSAFPGTEIVGVRALPQPEAASVSDDDSDSEED